MKTSMGLAVLASFAVAGCVTSEQYQAGLDDVWTGAEEAALVEQFGPPDEVTEGDGVRIVKWKSSSEITNSSSGSVGEGVSIGFSTTSLQHCRLSAHVDGEGRAVKFEWKATEGDIGEEREMRFGVAGECSRMFPTRVRKPKTDRRAEPWIGRSGDDLLAAYEVAPDTYTPDGGETRWLTWSDVKTRATTGTNPDPDIRDTQSITGLCSVSFAVVDGVVDRYLVRGMGGCPMPESE